MQDVGLSGEDDSTILEWAAVANRVLLTHDVTTITNFAYERVELGKRMPGVIEVNRSVPRSVFSFSFLAEGFASKQRHVGVHCLERSRLRKSINILQERLSDLLLLTLRNALLKFLRPSGLFHNILEETPWSAVIRTPQ